MPNDCVNSFSIIDITHDQWHDLAATFQVRDEGCQQDFLKTFYPEPDYSAFPVARTCPEIDAKHAKSEEEREQIINNEPSIREDSWYDWRNQHWGTKWDVYSCCTDWEDEVPSDVFSVGFCTAWSPLSEECMAVISEKLPGSLLTNYYQEDGMDFFGATVSKDGLVRNFKDSLSKYRESFARQQLPDLDARLEEEGLDLDDYLDEFFWDDCDPEEFDDYIHCTLESLVKQMIQEIEEATTNPLASA